MFVVPFKPKKGMCTEQTHEKTNFDKKTTKTNWSMMGGGNMKSAKKNVFRKLTIFLLLESQLLSKRHFLEHILGEKVVKIWIYHIFEKIHFSRFFEIFRHFSRKCSVGSAKWQKFLPKTEISADPIFLRSDTKYHISDSFLTLYRIPRNCDKKYFFDVFKDYSVIWASFHFFMQFHHILGGEVGKKFVYLPTKTCV